MSDYKNYKYYKGESENPYTSKDFGKAFWWTVELYAVQKKDEKEREMLSMTMVNYIRAHHWNGEGHDTTKEEMLKRASELYQKGLWSRDYIGIKKWSLKQVEELNKKN